MPMLCNFFLSWNCEMTSLHLSKRYVLALSVSFHSFCTSPSPKLPTLIIVSNSPALPYLTGRTTEAPTVSCVCPLWYVFPLTDHFLTLMFSSRLLSCNPFFYDLFIATFKSLLIIKYGVLINFVSIEVLW